MKISNLLLPLTTVQASWERPSYAQIYQRIRDGAPLNLSKKSNIRSDHSLIAECGGVNHPNISNSTVIAAVPNSNGVWCDGNTCTALCLPGYTGVGRLRSRCIVRHTRNQETKARWTADLTQYQCITCAEDPEPTDKSGMNVSNCGVSSKRVHQKQCTYRCKNQHALAHPLLLGKRLRARTRAICKCNRKSKTCAWKIASEMGGNPADIACSDTKIKRGNKYDEDLVKECKHKPAKCTDIGLSKFTKLNSWECRNCFRIRVQYKMAELGIMDFDKRDYLDLQFDQEVVLQNLPTTIAATDVGNDVQRITFP